MKENAKEYPMVERESPRGTNLEKETPKLESRNFVWVVDIAHWMAAGFIWLPGSEMSTVTGLRLQGRKVHAGRTGNPCWVHVDQGWCQNWQAKSELHWVSSSLLVIVFHRSQPRSRTRKPESPLFCSVFLTHLLAREIFTRHSPASVIAMKQGNNRWILRWKAIIWHKTMLFT